MERKLERLWQRAMSRHGTATSLSESLPNRPAEKFDINSDGGFDSAAYWGSDSNRHNEDEFQDRLRIMSQMDEDHAYRPDLYSDAFQVADGDLLLYDLESDELPRADGAEVAVAVEMDEVCTEIEKEIPPIADTELVVAPTSSTSVHVSPLQVPTTPPSTAPRGFARKHQDILVVSPTVEEVSKTSPRKCDFEQLPQGSAAAAIAALRPDTKRVCCSISVALVEKPLKTWPHQWLAGGGGRTSG